MEIGKEVLAYARGELFDVGYQMPIQENGFMFRTDCILQLTRGKKVLHVGCCDHKDLILEKIKDNEWLQGLLDKNCSEVVGIDINRDALKFIKDNHLTSSRLLYNNIVADPPVEGGGEPFDFILLGEILEHTPNPVEFLKNINEKYSGCVDSIIITVPNAFGYKVLRRWEKYKEFINSDHVYWFTPYTLVRVMALAGFAPEKLFFADTELTFLSRCIHKVTGKYLNIRNKHGMTLICVGKFGKALGTLDME